jgi:hypothetical protein
MSKLAIAKVKATVEIRLTIKLKTKARDFRRLTATGRNEEARGEETKKEKARHHERLTAKRKRCD